MEIVDITPQLNAFNTEQMQMVAYYSSSEAKVTIPEYIIWYYNQVKPHQFNTRLTPNESEHNVNNDYKFAKFTLDYFKYLLNKYK